ncbi:MAG: 9-O-acetylesterase [Ignavibacteriae bacterium]|nr:9-O-acetylesterase [Ignavibacteriota bacterium]
MKSTNYVFQFSFIKFIKYLIIFLFYLQINVVCQSSNPPAKNIKLNPLFTDNMILQQNKTITIWGKAEPGGKIIIKLLNQEKQTISDVTGNWKVNLEPINAGGPYEIKIIGEQTIVIKNVMIGEVWICSGQSNMEMQVGGSGKVLNYKDEIANAKYPNIRLLTVEKKMAETPQDTFSSEGWKQCSPETISDFSAVAYFFGRELYKNLNVPIGLINTSWGGTVVEAWISGNSLKKNPDFLETVKIIESDTTSDSEKAEIERKKINEWPDKIEKILNEKGIFSHDFQNLSYNSDSWQEMSLPKLWEDDDLTYDGVVWFIKEINLNDAWKGNKLLLSLGKINDYDVTWFNGYKVGRGVDVQDLRKYDIPDSIVNHGKNIIAVAVLDIGNVGGIYGPAKELKLEKHNESISLSGNWKFKIDPITIDVSKLPEKPTSNVGPNRPTVLFNGMINPLIPFNFQGVIWYQGESNAERAYQYRELFKTQINDWRENWGGFNFPFLFVQLANFKKVNSNPSDDSWAELREAQLLNLNLDNTGMAVTIDIGEEKDIHPKNKQEVGKRLALNALAKVYKQEVTYSGPIYDSMKIEDGKIIIKFSNTDGGLISKGNNKLLGFQIAGEDKKFVWAEAEISGNEVNVSNQLIKKPVAVRYAWASNPICNLYNGAGLPASPFRTDDWPGITYGKK